jgi:hypothetical protein
MLLKTIGNQQKLRILSLMHVNSRTFVSSSDVGRLRKDTGSPLSECKAALEESSGNFENAKKWLREKGSSYADK